MLRIPRSVAWLGVRCNLSRGLQSTRPANRRSRASMPVEGFGLDTVSPDPQRRAARASLIASQRTLSSESMVPNSQLNRHAESRAIGAIFHPHRASVDLGD